MVLLAGLGASLWQMGRAMTAEEEARQNEQRAIANAELARQNEQRAIANARQERMAKLLAESEKRRAIAFRDQALDALRATTGTDVERFLATKKQLTPHDRAFLEAIARRWQELARQEGTDQESRAIAAKGYFRVGLLWQRLGRREEARTEYERAVALQEKLVTDFPAVPDYRRDLARSHSNIGNLLKGLGQRAGAEEHYRKGLALQEKLVAEYPSLPDHRSDLARSYNNMALLLIDLGQRDEAEQHHRKGLAIWEKLVAEFPGILSYRMSLATSHSNLGMLLQNAGRPTEAEEQFCQALAIREKVVSEFPVAPGYHIDFAGGCCDLGHRLRASGRAEDSLVWFDKAVATLVPIHRAQSADQTVKSLLRSSHAGRALAYDQLGKFDEAVKDWDRVIELSPPAEQPRFRVSRAISRLEAGQVASAVAEVAELTKLPGAPAPILYDFARIYAVASDRIADKKEAGVRRPGFRVATTSGQGRLQGRVPHESR